MRIYLEDQNSVGTIQRITVHINHVLQTWHGEPDLETVANKTVTRELQKFFLLSLLFIVSANCQSDETKIQTHAPENQAQTQYGPIMLGDTLSNIAYTMFPDSSLTREQIMWAIYSSNPDAFVDNDINSLKRGVTLNIPGHDEINSTPPRTAKQSLVEHTNLTPREVKKINKKLESTRESIDAQQQEKEILKARLAEMQKQIQQLTEQNRKKDKELQNLDEQIKQ